MKELILGLLGGGAVTQLLNTLATLRQNRRQINAAALGTEVEALEKTIAVLYANLERQNALHREEVKELRGEIAALRREKQALEERVRRLGEQLRSVAPRRATEEGLLPLFVGDDSRPSGC